MINDPKLKGKNNRTLERTVQSSNGQPKTSNLDEVGEASQELTAIHI